MLCSECEINVGICTTVSGCDLHSVERLGEYVKQMRLWASLLCTTLPIVFFFFFCVPVCRLPKFGACSFADKTYDRSSQSDSSEC